MSQIDTDRKSERRPDRAALAIAAGLLVIAGVIAWDASRLGGTVQYARIGPQTVPYVIALCLAGLGLWTIVEALRGDFPEREKQETRPVLWIVGGLLLQLLLIKFVGFAIATGLMFGFVARGFGERRLWIAIPAGILFAAIVWLIFAKGLSLTLPAGPLENALGAVLQSIIALFRPAAGAA
ncbi:MAG: tripartite tricarboxylate transporter TctB family protein [Hyphomicrobiales bacterium]|nr:MAG: tripartite tricarboxylate transporter TctB family protein [Hyphomicrobiales bacterium]